MFTFTIQTHGFDSELFRRCLTGVGISHKAEQVDANTWAVTVTAKSIKQLKLIIALNYVIRLQLHGMNTRAKIITYAIEMIKSNPDIDFIYAWG